MAFRKHTKVFTVFSFLRLRSVDIVWYQCTYPTFIAAVLILSFLLLESQSVTFDVEKLVADINSLMGILVGFYIAALAAVSSFSNKNLDQVMKGRAPTLTTTRKGQQVKEPLTRRRFLAVLFGYCAVLSIVLYISGAFYLRLLFSNSGLPWVQIVKWVAWIVYTWMISSLLVVTLLGLHYLVERMHRE